MRDQFSQFYVPNEDTIATAMKTGLVVPDANVLLNLYRFQSGARDQLFGALEKLSERLWIPYQAALEFHRNRLNVIAEQEAYFGKTEKELTDAIEGLRAKFRAFRARIALNPENARDIEETITRLGDLVEKVVGEAGGANEVRLHVHASDEVLARIDTLFEKRVGTPMEPGELEEAKKEAERRITERTPPGYIDRKKDDPTGDYLVWRQLLMEAKARSLPVVFISDDTKEDWYQHFKGMTLGARRELREEMTREAGVHLLMMTTQTFLLHAEAYLDAEVSDETIAQAKELPDLSPVTVWTPKSWNVDVQQALRTGWWESYLERAQEGTLSNAEAVMAVIAMACVAFTHGRNSEDNHSEQDAEEISGAIEGDQQEPEDEPFAEN